MQETPVLLTVDQAAQRLNCGRTMVFKLIAQGDLESVPIGRLRRVPVDAIPDCVKRLRDKAVSRTSA